MRRPIILLATSLAVFAAPPVGNILMPGQPNINYGVIVPIPFLVKDKDAPPKGDILNFLRDTSTTDPYKKTHLDVGAIRIDLFWNDMQRLETDPVSIDSRIPAAVHAAIQKKIHVFASLSNAPDWATGGPCVGCKPDNAHLGAWKAFVQFVLNTFQSDLADMTFGIWNEPDQHGFSPSDYKDLVDRANQTRTGATAGARFGVLESTEGAINAPGSWVASTLVLIQPLLQARDVLTVHWYPGNRSQDLAAYMDKVLSAAGTRETWLTETGETKVEDAEQQATIGAILDVFNRRPSTQWSKIFVYRLFGGDSYDLMKTRTVNFVEELRGRESFFTMHRKIRTFAINLRADNSQFVSAPDNGLGTVGATAMAAAAREMFVLEDLDGELLRDGDVVTLRSTGGMYLRVFGSNRVLSAVSDCACTDYDRYVVETGTPGPVGDVRVAFRSEATRQYVSRDLAVGARLLANATTVTNRETFQVIVR